MHHRQAAPLSACRSEISRSHQNGSTGQQLSLEAWGDQADETGRGLVERNFLDSCVEANGDLSELKAMSYCTCVFAKVKAAVSFEEFTKFDDFIDTHRTDVTAEMLGENFGWFAEAVEACPV